MRGSSYGRRTEEILVMRVVVMLVSKVVVETSLLQELCLVMREVMRKVMRKAIPL